jgi:hypothetical protein
MRAASGTLLLLRRGLLGLALVTTLALGLELAAERHWTRPSQLVAWAALAALLAAVGLAAGKPDDGKPDASAATPARVQLARLLAVLVVVSAVWGIWEHVASNYEAGELDQEYMLRWEGLPEASRWWLALSKTVGPSPPLAPGALAQAGACVLLATIRTLPRQRPA